MNTRFTLESFLKAGLLLVSLYLIPGIYFENRYVVIMFFLLFSLFFILVKPVVSYIPFSSNFYLNQLIHLILIAILIFGVSFVFTGFSFQLFPFLLALLLFSFLNFIIKSI